MIENSPNKKLPVSFKNVAYFNNSYLGDLVVLPEVLYYFPHTNIEGERNRRSHSANGGLAHFGLLGLLILAVINVSQRFIRSPSSDTESTANRVRIKQVLQETDASAIQKQLDDLYVQAKNENIKIGEFDLPKPMRFRKSEVKNMSAGGKLKFDTEYDDHDFIVGFFKTKQLREALWMAGFLR